MKVARREAGFTLVEVLIAAFIFAFATLAILAGLVATVRTAEKAGHRFTAPQVALSHFQRMDALYRVSGETLPAVSTPWYDKAFLRQDADNNLFYYYIKTEITEILDYGGSDRDRYRVEIEIYTRDPREPEIAAILGDPEYVNMIQRIYHGRYVCYGYWYGGP